VLIQKEREGKIPRALFCAIRKDQIDPVIAAHHERINIIRPQIS